MKVRTGAGRVNASGENRLIAPHEEQTSADQLNNRIFFRLFQLGNTLQRQSVKELGVTTVQWAVIGALSQKHRPEGMAFGDLAEYLVVSRQNLDGVIKRLERGGIVERATDPNDRRARLVRLTPAGHRLWPDLRNKIFEFYRQAAAGFSFDERASLVHFLGKLQAQLLTVEIGYKPPSLAEAEEQKPG
jgi:DNA-binding MarR family transcriptional regulator